MSWWNFVLKIFYITSSAYIVYLMMRRYARTREKEYGWKLATWTLGGSLVSAPFVTLLFEGWAGMRFSEVSLIRSSDAYIEGAPDATGVLAEGHLRTS